jgi:hypothetical protein
MGSIRQSWLRRNRKALATSPDILLLPGLESPIDHREISLLTQHLRAVDSFRAPLARSDSTELAVVSNKVVHIAKHGPSLSERDRSYMPPQSGYGDISRCRPSHTPGIRVRPRRFGGLSTRQLFHGKQPQTTEASFGEDAMQSFREAQPPRSLWTEDSRTGRPFGAGRAAARVQVAEELLAARRFVTGPRRQVTRALFCCSRGCPITLVDLT